jgi:hypothetical protein
MLKSYATGIPCVERLRQNSSRIHKHPFQLADPWLVNLGSQQEAPGHKTRSAKYNFKPFESNMLEWLIFTQRISFRPRRVASDQQSDWVPEP